MGLQQLVRGLPLHPFGRQVLKPAPVNVCKGYDYKGDEHDTANHREGERQAGVRRRFHRRGKYQTMNCASVFI